VVYPVTDECPPAWDRHEELAAHAAYELHRRVEMFPPLVERGKVSAEEAQTETAIWRTIAAEWGAPEAGEDISADRQQDAIAEARRRAGAKLADLHGRLPTHERYFITFLTTIELAACVETGSAGKGMRLFLIAERRAVLLDALHWWARPWIAAGHRTTRAAINHLNIYLRTPQSEAA
jgi:hypothetical protein